MPPTNSPYGNTYNPNWRNHPNLSWKPKPQQYAPLLEQVILNLSKMVGNFVEEQKAINTQLNQKIETVESILNNRIDGLQNNISHKIDNL